MEAEIRDVQIERYYPDVDANAKEMKALAAAVDPELVDVWKALWKWMLNTFVLDIDEAGATRWEKMLQIRSSSTDTLEQRQNVILAKINAVLPYTYRRLQQILDMLCGVGTYEILLDYAACEFGLRVLSGAKGIDRICGLLQPILPMNLNMFMEIVRQTQIDLHVGILTCNIGSKHIGIPVPMDSSMVMHTGVVYLRAGKQITGIARPSETHINAHTGIIIRRTGRITIGGIR